MRHAATLTGMKVHARTKRQEFSDDGYQVICGTTCIVRMKSCIVKGGQSLYDFFLSSLLMFVNDSVVMRTKKMHLHIPAIDYYVCFLLFLFELIFPLLFI